MNQFYQNHLIRPTDPLTFRACSAAYSTQKTVRSKAKVSFYSSAFLLFGNFFLQFFFLSAIFSSAFFSRPFFPDTLNIYHWKPSIPFFIFYFSCRISCYPLSNWLMFLNQRQSISINFLFLLSRHLGWCIKHRMGRKH